MVFALHQLDKKTKSTTTKKQPQFQKKKKISGFATFTVTSIVKKTKQNLTLSELLEGKKNERNRKRFKDL